MHIYDQGFSSQNIIGKHDSVIKKKILSQLSEDDVFINSTWLEIDDNLKGIADKNKNAICYSGPDWENTICRKKQNEFIDANFKSVYRVGNTRGNYYFSFWLDFVYKNLNSYEKFDPYKIDKLKTFMCLNRKPHAHRKKLVDEIFYLKNYGFLSLGGKKAIKLEKDIPNYEGDLAAANNYNIVNDITSLGNKNYWNSHFINVVSETTIHTDAFVSEKTLKPIIGRRPFIVLGDNNLYDILHHWGIDTFDDLFGHGYKSKNYEDRIIWIKQVLEHYCLRENKLENLLISLKPRLENNYQNLLIAARENLNSINNLFN